MTYPEVQQPGVDLSKCSRAYPNRPIAGIVLHHTGGEGLYTPSSQNSWASAHVVITKDGTRHRQVPDARAAYSVRASDRMRPNWTIRAPDGKVSDINYCTKSYELTYRPQEPWFESPTFDQVASLREALWLDFAQYGTKPHLGHGVLQLDRWLNEPAGLVYGDLGLGGFQPYVGMFLIEEPEVTNPADDATVKGWLETYGTPVNMQTGIMQFAASSFRNGQPPTGEWRGPALPPPGQTEGGEYPETDQDGQPTGRIRHRFSQGIVFYDPTTGGLGWVETERE